jgi:hypothetical protein
MTLHLSEEKQNALLESIHRLAQEHEPNCTLEQVKKCCNLLNGRGYTRQDAAFCLYWELSEKIENSRIACSFLRLLASRCKDDHAAEERIRQAAKAGRERVKYFWIADERKGA